MAVMQFDPERITFFARTDARGQNVPFGIKAKDRTKHVYVIGKTGMGKSTMLENMAVQDIKNGEGMTFIDPHGATAEKLLEYIPENRIDDVLYFAPFDMAYPVSFNVMEDVGYDRRHLVVSGLMSTFKKIWVDAWSARMEYILSNTILALLEFPGATLLGVNRMLSDKEYRKLVVDNVKDPSVKSFWVDEFANYNERYMQEAGDAIKNKIGQFTANPLIRNIVGQPKSSFDVRQMMDERKILIINLSKGLVGETNANLLGSMFITRVYLSAMSRADMSPSEMERAPNFYLYVDEFQSFANETFAGILSEARKYKLNLTIAHQYIEQMEEEVRNAVFGNVGTTISFRVGPFDAEVLETVFAPQFTATDLVNLGFAQIYLTLSIDGIGSKPFSAQTLPPIDKAGVSHRDQVIAASRRKYAKRREEVEHDIGEWHAPIRKPAATGEGARSPGVKKDVRGGVSRPAVGERPDVMRAPRPPVPAAVSTSQGAAQRRAPIPTPRPLTTPAPGSPPRPSPAKNVEDLRSVLRGIAANDKKPERRESAPAEPTDVPRAGIVQHAGKPVPQQHAPRERVRPAPGNSHQNLKDALRAALGGEGSTPALKPEPLPERAPAPEPTIVEAEAQGSAHVLPLPPDPAPQRETEPEPALPRPEILERAEHHDITREELERILSVHKNERPPI